MPQPLRARAKLSRVGGISALAASASRRAEHFLLTSIVQLLTECIFWTRPAPGANYSRRQLLANAAIAASRVGSQPRVGTYWQLSLISET